MRFTDAHSGSSVCTPTRYGLLTGRYSWRSRLQQGVVQADDSCLIAEDRLTIAGFLKGHGYHTGIIGKWHLDYVYTDPETFERITPESNTARIAGVPIGTRIPDGPVSRGFDYFFGFHHHRSMKSVVENDRIIKEVEPVEMLQLLTEKSVKFIHNAAENDKKPFFLYIPLNSPHAPFTPSKPWQGRSGMGAYADFVMETDWAVGQIILALENNELTENTLIIFTSDNGTPPNEWWEEMKSQGHFPVANLRGMKSDIWEGGHRVPFFAKWPGQIIPGSVSNETICHVDFMATCADLIGAELPENVSEDGVSYLSLFYGRPLIRTREAIVHHSIQGKFSIRSGKWKLVFCAGSGGWSSPRDIQAMEQGLPEVQLYNIESDPSETTNIFSRHPEIVKELTFLMEEYISNGRSTYGKKLENDVPVELWK